MRTLLLFDIDGTLLTGGPAKAAFRRALLEVYGDAGPIEEWEFSGKTDPQIARELLREAGMADPEIEAGFEELWRRYLAGMARRMTEDPTQLLPGVAALVEALEGEAGVALGLLTGNVMEGARLKLRPVGLEGRFAIGAYGSDHEERNELPAIAVERARRWWRAPFEPPTVVVIGDTPRDIECGRWFGTRTVGVATGRFTAASLEEAGADRVLADLDDLERAMSALLEE